VKDAPIHDWVKPAVTRARNAGMPAVFRLDSCRPHENLSGDGSRLCYLDVMKTIVATALFTLAAPAFAESAPTDFVTQVLEPTGGRIARPQGWFYSEAHRGAVYMWTLSREDTSGNRPYTTGVRIQTFVGVKPTTGKTARQFILDFAAAKKKEAKVVNSCKEQDQGIFTRICLETEEGPHHILYSLFWGSKGMDVAVVTIAGTTRELWPTYAPAFAKMADFELIDMKRFE
jgi:hypothetical protein